MPALSELSRRSHVLSSPVLLACGLALLIAAGCKPAGSEANSTGPTQVRLQLNWVPEPQFGGVYEARRLGLFEGEQLNVEVRAGSGGISAPQLVATGEVEFGIVGGSQILQLNQEGGELVALFAVYQHDPHGIMVPADSPFQSLEALWKSSSATIGAEASLAFIKALNRAIGEPGGARFVAYNLPAFRAGRQSATQCFVTAEPVTLQLEGFKTRVFSASKVSGFDPYNTVLVTRRSYLESHPDECRRMVDAFTQGWTAYLKDPAPTNAILAQLNPSMSLEAMDLTAKKQLPLIEDENTRRLGLGCMTSERWNAIAEQLKSFELLDGIPDIDSLFIWPPQPVSTTSASG